jgi:hypothetical protein
VTERSEIRILRAELLDVHRELMQLRQQAEQLIATNRDLSGMLAASSQRASDLLKMIVAFHRLLDAPDAAGALQSVEEVLVTVIGTEDYAVLQVSDQSTLHPVRGMGPTLARVEETPVALARLHETDGRAVPMYIGDHLVGVIVIGELLPHRGPLNASDEQVLALVSRFAASAVMAAGQRNAWTRLALPPLA